MSSGLLEKLIAVVRPEFRVEVYLVDPDDPVLGRRRCAVAKCDRPVSGNGLCSGHGQRWRDRDRPAIAVFLADPGPCVEWPPGSERLHCDRMSIRQQRRRVVHATSAKRGPVPVNRIRASGRPRQGCSVHRIPDNVGCRFAPCGPRTPGPCTASLIRHGGSSSAAPMAQNTSRTASSAAQRASTSAG